jgi:hypothetical protein
MAATTTKRVVDSQTAISIRQNVIDTLLKNENFIELQVDQQIEVADQLVSYILYGKATTK